MSLDCGANSGRGTRVHQLVASARKRVIIGPVWELPIPSVHQTTRGLLFEAKLAGVEDVNKKTATLSWLGLALLGALCLLLAAGWWQSQRALSAELAALKAQAAAVVPPATPSDLRKQNAELTEFIDEVYTLLAAEGFKIHLDFKVDPVDGRMRLYADSAKVSEQFRAKVRELNEHDN